MAEKLKSISERIPWFLLAKAVFLSAVWILLPFWVFILAALILFFKSGPQPFKLWVSFTALIILASLPRWHMLPPITYGFADLLAFCFFTIFGIREFFFIRRTLAYLSLSAAVFSLLAFYFFLSLTPESFVWPALMFFASTMFLVLEFTGVVGLAKTKERFLFASAFSFLILEIAWVISLLPVGFLNSAAFLLLAFAFLEHMFFDYREGVLRPRLASHTAIFASCALFIAALSNWKM